jgi:hypothetical protein
MRIREFENCVGMIMPRMSFGFLIHHAFHSAACIPKNQPAIASPSGTVEQQLSGIEHLRQAFQRLMIAARVVAVFGLYKRLRLTFLHQQYLSACRNFKHDLQHYSSAFSISEPTPLLLLTGHFRLSAWKLRDLARVSGSCPMSLRI